ncbi:hypothetical protein F4808DRAFT_434887 [Astrocystis sublimbata]|nr:hypothetical protein F4808DRAFT_434887 [Astrocystis sublimbata]
MHLRLIETQVEDRPSHLRATIKRSGPTTSQRHSSFSRTQPELFAIATNEPVWSRYSITTREMCHILCIKYTCECQKDGQFVQCEERQGTNVKCHSIPKIIDKFSTHYCSAHLVKAGTQKICYERNPRPRDNKTQTEH